MKNQERHALQGKKLAHAQHQVTVMHHAKGPLKTMANSAGGKETDKTNEMLLKMTKKMTELHCDGQVAATCEAVCFWRVKFAFF